MNFLELAQESEFWLSSALFGVTAFLAGLWGPQIFKHAFDQRLELLKRRLVLRDKASVIAELLTLSENPENIETINKGLLELCLCLPPCLIHKLSHTMKGDKHQLDIGRLPLFLEIRDFIEGNYKIDKSKKLNPDNIPQLVLIGGQAATKFEEIAITPLAKEPAESH